MCLRARWRPVLQRSGRLRFPCRTWFPAKQWFFVPVKARRLTGSPPVQCLLPLPALRGSRDGSYKDFPADEMCIRDSLEDKVIDSRMSKDGTTIRRRRVCLRCDYRSTTYEQIERTELRVVKRDNLREALNRAKILRGLVTVSYTHLRGHTRLPNLIKLRIPCNGTWQ